MVNPESAHLARQRPTSPSDLFWSFTRLALQGFGGVVAIVQRELVEKKQWLTAEEFVEDWAVAQVMPGPNVVNLSLMIGSRYFGWVGGLAALAGMLLFPLLILLVVVIVFGGLSELPQSQNALRGLGAVAAGMIMAAGLKMAPTLMKNPMGAPVTIVLAASTLIATAWLRMPLPLVLMVLGGIGVGWCYRCLGRPGAANKDAQP
ncbi:chromate transporter [Curvibacter sp. APW13]|uniref:chromate transporter n=1 Tax=Curvibacter sp. APW13 TaxID=3077236 RepID=UPI0028E0258D|nr:chromate transporter [Curvibacter sp. APW13]MDT8991699.1 chromate transporter [Curvibacter sp. APW13]